MAHDPTMHIIMISAHDRMETLKRACKNGIHAYVVKPFGIRQLATLIEQVKTEHQDGLMPLLKNHTFQMPIKCPSEVKTTLPQSTVCQS